jgi:hypothetical protein
MHNQAKQEIVKTILGMATYAERRIIPSNLVGEAREFYWQITRLIAKLSKSEQKWLYATYPQLDELGNQLKSLMEQPAMAANPGAKWHYEQRQRNIRGAAGFRARKAFRTASQYDTRADEQHYSEIESERLNLPNPFLYNPGVGFKEGQTWQKGGHSFSVKRVLSPNTARVIDNEGNRYQADMNMAQQQGYSLVGSGTSNPGASWHKRKASQVHERKFATDFERGYDAGEVEAHEESASQSESLAMPNPQFKQYVREVFANPQGISRSQLVKILSRADIQRKISKVFKRQRPIKVDVPSSAGAKYIHFRMKPPSWFDSSSFRTISAPKKKSGKSRHRAGEGTRFVIGCPAGSYNDGSCEVGTEIQSVLIPIPRVMRIVSKYARIPKKVLANPLLMTVCGLNPPADEFVDYIENIVDSEPKILYNPDNEGRECPFDEGQEIPIEEFEAWLKKSGTPEEIARYEQTKEACQKFHLGTPVQFVTRKVINLGVSQAIVDRDFTYSMGKTPSQMYVPNDDSGKAPHAYVHEYETEPEALVAGNGKLILEPLEGRAIVTDWIHH